MDDSASDCNQLWICLPGEGRFRSCYKETISRLEPRAHTQILSLYKLLATFQRPQNWSPCAMELAWQTVSYLRCEEEHQRCTGTLEPWDWKSTIHFPHCQRPRTEHWLPGFLNLEWEIRSQSWSSGVLGGMVGLPRVPSEFLFPHGSRC